LNCRDETKEKLVKNAVGLWIDHRKAVIVVITDQGEETLSLRHIDKEQHHVEEKRLAGQAAD
jgi:hypothetical protein